VFKNGGVFAPMVPTIHCKTCKERRDKRMSVIEQEQDKGFVFMSVLLDLELLHISILSSNVLYTLF
jgi:hypothetical protein